jgi:hypothetical protein
MVLPGFAAVPSPEPDALFLSATSKLRQHKSARRTQLRCESLRFLTLPRNVRPCSAFCLVNTPSLNMSIAKIVIFRCIAAGILSYLFSKLSTCCRSPIPGALVQKRRFDVFRRGPSTKNGSLPDRERPSSPQGSAIHFPQDATCNKLPGNGARPRKGGNASIFFAKEMTPVCKA